jgi:hypothetical protein
MSTILYWDLITKVQLLDAGNITFIMAARTVSSWLALGLSREGTGMKGMDVALLRRNEVRRLCVCSRSVDGHHARAY